MLGQPGYDFDSQKFIYIGAPNKDNPVFVSCKNSGITSADKWSASPAPVKVGGPVPGNLVDNCDRIVKEVLGFPTQIITGYKGTADILIAMESGEVDAGPPSWDTVKTNRRSALESGDMIAILKGTAKPLKEFPNVPKFIDFAKTEEQKRNPPLKRENYVSPLAKCSKLRFATSTIPLKLLLIHQPMDSLVCW